MNGKSRQPHTSNTLEHRAFHHNHAIILRERNIRLRPRSKLRALLFLLPIQWARDITRRHTADNLVLRKLAGIFVGLAGRHECAPIAQVCFVAFVAYVANQVGPGDSIGGANEPRVCYWTEGFANVGGVGDVAVGGEENCADAIGVSGIAVVGVG